MSIADVERQLADYFGWLEAGMGEISDLTNREAVVAPGHATTGQGLRRPWWTAVTAASLLALLVGLLLISGRGAVNDAVSTTPTGPSLGDVNDVAEDEWLYPTTVPALVRYAYTITDRPNSLRSVHFVSEADPVGYAVEIGQADGDSDLGTSTPEQTESEGGRMTEELGGHRWDVAFDDDVWFATLDLDSTSVRVSGPAAFDDSARTFIEGLVVVAEADLPSRPLDFDGGFIDVARYEGDGGLTAAIGVAESNGYFCIKFRGPIGGGGGCPVGPAPDAVLSSVVAASGHGDVGQRIDVAGITRSDVDLVEISLADGTVVRTTPTDLSGQFDVRFWVVSSEVITGAENPAESWSGINDLVTEIRAYDIAGELLALQHPGEAN